MSQVYDNWERLVRATLRRETLRQCALEISDSTITSTSSSLSSRSGSNSSYISPGHFTSFMSQSEVIPMYVVNFERSNYCQIVEPENKEKPLMKRTFPSTQVGHSELRFFGGYNFIFDLKLEDLFNAPAEVLGKGTFGTSYTVQVGQDHRTVISVKRLKKILNVREEDFAHQMEVVGGIRHKNVVSPRAYFSSKDKKLILYDYFRKGSVSRMLHEKRHDERNRVPLSLKARLRIAFGAARGFSHVHAQHGGTLVHGNVKASNIFLNSERFGCISDLGLATLAMNRTASTVIREMQSSGYLAPEVLDAVNISQASDVYSFGVFLLELLTRKPPLRLTESNEVIHLVRWVHSVVEEEWEWAAKVFDVELFSYKDVQSMVSMLRIAMSCVARVPEQRPKMLQVVQMIKNVARMNEQNPKI